MWACSYFSANLVDLALIFEGEADGFGIVAAEGGENVFLLVIQEFPHFPEVFHAGVGELSAGVGEPFGQLQNHLDMVGDPFGVIGAVHQQRDQFRLRFSELAAGDLDQVRCDFGLHFVDSFLHLVEGGELFLIDFAGNEVVVDRAIHHRPGVVDHFADGADRLLERHGRSRQQVGFQEFDLDLRVFRNRQQPGARVFRTAG